MTPSIQTPQVKELLDALYADAEANDPLVHQAAKESGAWGASDDVFYRAVNKAYMPVTREFGNLLYVLGRSTRAETVVEFGTSFGISTIYLAAAVRDNGRGKVITTEFDESKVERARKNLARAGLEEWVEFRLGDALETLSPPPEGIGFVLLDGPKAMYPEVLKLLEPSLLPGAVIASDNTDHDGMEPFLEYIRDGKNVYASSAILTAHDGKRGHEVTVRL